MFMNDLSITPLDIYLFVGVYWNKYSLMPDDCLIYILLGLRFEQCHYVFLINFIKLCMQEIQMALFCG